MTNINAKINQIAIEKYGGNNVAFAEDMETSEANIRNYRKTTVPKLDFIEKLAAKLEISFDELFTGKKPTQVTVVNDPGADIMPKVVTVDKHGNDNVVLVPVKASAGYLNGYGDPNFIKKLPSYRFPNLNHGTFRMFQVGGHSMRPTLHDGSFVIGQWVENWQEDIKDDRVYIIVSVSDGIVIKRCLNRIKKYGNIYCKSDNRREYPNFGIDPKNILEVWEHKLHISYELSNPNELYERVNDLEAEIMHLKDKL